MKSTSAIILGEADTAVRTDPDIDAFQNTVVEYQRTITPNSADGITQNPITVEGACPAHDANRIPPEYSVPRAASAVSTE